MANKCVMPAFCLFKLNQVVRHKNSGDLYIIICTPFVGVMKVGDEWKPAYFYKPTDPTKNVMCSRIQHDFEGKFESVRSVSTDPRVGDEIEGLNGVHRLVVNVENTLLPISRSDGNNATVTNKEISYRIVGEEAEYKVGWGSWSQMCKDSVVRALAD